MPVIAEMLNFTTDIYKKVMKNMHSSDMLTDAWKPKEAGLTRGFDHFQLGINYRWSDIVFDERFTVEGSVRQAYGAMDREVRAGDRAPDAPSLECLYPGTGVKSPNCLFDLFDPSKHVALVFRGSDSGAATPIYDALRMFPTGAMINVLILPPDGNYDLSVNPLVDYVLRDTMGHAHEGYGLIARSPSPAAVIVRPDAYVGAFVTTSAGVEKYRSLVFN